MNFDSFDDNDGLDSLGAVDASTFLQSGAALVSSEVSALELSSDDKKKAGAAINADVAAAQALAKADTTAPKVGRPTSPTADTDALAAKLATQASDKAAAQLSAAAQKKRADAADAALNAAISKAQNDPKNEFQAALVRAWTTIDNKANGGAIASDSGLSGGKGGKGKKGASSDSFLTRPVLGGLPGWSVLVGGAGLLGGIGLAVKKYVLKS